VITPAQAYLRQIWWRHRHGLMADAAYVVIASVVVRLLPPNMLRMTIGQDDLPLFAYLLGLPCGFVVVHLLAIFSVVSNDFKETSFSPRMYVLPVSTRFLVTWPMASGCVTLTLFWLVVATQILWPAGFAAALWWPPIFLAACLSALQAISWLPLAQSWMRICVAVPALTPLVIVQLAVIIFHRLLPYLIVAAAVLIPINYLVALGGVARGRRGDLFEWHGWNAFVAWLLRLRKARTKPFASAAAAQFWFECRALGWYVPLFLGWWLVMFGPMLLFIDDEQLTNWKNVLPCLVGFPLFMAGAIAMQLGARDMNSGFAMGSFMGARPIVSAALVRAKVWMCGVSAVATTAAVLLWPSLLFLRPAVWQAAQQAIASEGLLKMLTILFLLPIGFTLALWLHLASSLWMGLTGRAWLANAVVFSCIGIAAAGIIVGGWLYFHPEHIPYVQPIVPWIVAGLLLLKLAIGAKVVQSLIETRQASGTATLSMLAVWLAAVAVLYGLVRWLVPEIPFSLLALGSLALMIPFNRLASAPLALEWNRHR
jgi:hypothetical protein